MRNGRSIIAAVLIVCVSRHQLLFDKRDVNVKKQKNIDLKDNMSFGQLRSSFCCKFMSRVCSVRSFNLHFSHFTFSCRLFVARPVCKGVKHFDQQPLFARKPWVDASVVSDAYHTSFKQARVSHYVIMTHYCFMVFITIHINSINEVVTLSYLSMCYLMQAPMSRSTVSQPCLHVSLKSTPGFFFVCICSEPSCWSFHGVDDTHAL